MSVSPKTADQLLIQTPGKSVFNKLLISINSEGIAAYQNCSHKLSYSSSPKVKLQIPRR